MSEENKEGLHVAIILDGNGRWAKKRFLPRSAGHIAGAKTLDHLCDVAYDMGIKYLTVYAFSTENFKRPQAEVEGIMMLLRQYLKDYVNRCKRGNMRVRAIGDLSNLADDIVDTIRELEEASAVYTGLNLQVAMGYGGHDEIVRATKKLCKDVVDGKQDIDSIDDSVFSGYLDTAGIPEPDLLIRPGGEKRLSNFLLWQCAYSEFYFSDVFWPDFNEKELQKALDYYYSRNRRFGDVK